MSQFNPGQKVRRWAAGLASTTILYVGGLLHAETAHPPPPPAVPAPEYHPSMGDLMTMAVQPRHIKLGLAGQAGNWTYATYELSELRNAFGRITRTIPQYRNADMTTLVTAMTQAPLDAVEAAIKAKDRTQFIKTYATLTAVCNACHVSQDHAMVVIKVPGGSAFSDQSFSPTDIK